MSRVANTKQRKNVDDDFKYYHTLCSIVSHRSQTLHPTVRFLLGPLRLICGRHKDERHKDKHRAGKRREVKRRKDEWHNKCHNKEWTYEVKSGRGVLGEAPRAGAPERQAPQKEEPR